MPRVLIAGFCAVPGPDRAGVQLEPCHPRAGAQPHGRRARRAARRSGLRRALRQRAPPAGAGPGRADPLQRIDAFRRALRRQLEGADYDVVHFRDGWSGVPVLEMQEPARTPRSSTPGARRWPSRRSTTSRPRPRWSATSSSARAAPTWSWPPPSRRRRYFARLVPAERVRLVPPGVDVDAFDWEASPPAGAPRILYAGALTPGRGVRVLLRAMLDVAAHVGRPPGAGRPLDARVLRLAGERGARPRPRRAGRAARRGRARGGARR